MTVEKVLRLVNELKPNALSTELKLQYLSEVEGMVQSDVMLIASADIVVYDESMLGALLLVKPPHDKLYIAYLTAMIDFANGEYNKYANTITVFNTYLAEYAAWYARRYHPIDGGAEEAGYYLSAYAIAVYHGFEGTEKEWLATLKGPAGKGEKGDVGRTVELRYNDDVLEWKYTDEKSDAWRELVSVAQVSAFAESAESAALSAEGYASDAERSAQSVGDELSRAQTAASEAAASAAAAAKSANEASGAAGGGVASFNGRSGIVNPASGDYTAEMVGAAAAEHEHEGYAAAEHEHEGYAAAEHNHDDKYATLEHSHEGSNFACGSYDGTKTYGEDNPNVLTFEFVPKIVIIAYSGRLLDLDTAHSLVLISGMSYAWAPKKGDTAVINVAWQGNSVTWYSTVSAKEQLNHYSGQRFVAIG